MIKTKTYSINMNDSETPAAWMGLPCLVDGSLKAGVQDSGRCLFTVATTDATALEAALDADDDVLFYQDTTMQLTDAERWHLMTGGPPTDACAPIVDVYRSVRARTGLPLRDVKLAVEATLEARAYRARTGV